VLLLVGVGVFLYVRKTEQQIAISSTSIPVAELEKQAADARHQLVLNHYNVAGTAFARIATEARGRQPIYDWARMQQGLAAMVARDEGQARQAFQAVDKAGANGFSKDDNDLANFFAGTSKMLLQSGSISGAEASKATQPFSAFALLPFALKDINQLDAQNAAALLDQFVKSAPVGKFAWIAELKPLAQKYLEDCRTYLAWTANPGAPPPDKKQLKIPRSAIADAIAGKVTVRRPSVVEPSETPSQPARQLNQNEIAAAAQKKSAWIGQWKKKLIDDLNHKQFSGVFTDTAGTEYTGVASADDQSLALKLPYGIARVPWSRLPPRALLTISTSFIQPNPSEAADRQWLCAVYASTTNQPEAARQLAEQAADSKPEYRDQLPILLGP
jgi:hypothetical protein